MNSKTKNVVKEMEDDLTSSLIEETGLEKSSFTRYEGEQPQGMEMCGGGGDGGGDGGTGGSVGNGSTGIRG